MSGRMAELDRLRKERQRGFLWLALCLAAACVPVLVGVACTLEVASESDLGTVEAELTRQDIVCRPRVLDHCAFAEPGELAVCVTGSSEPLALVYGTEDTVLLWDGVEVQR